MKYLINNINLVIFFLLILGFYNSTLAQNHSFLLKGVVLNDSGTHVFNCSIKLVQQKTGTILTFFNTGNKEEFVVPINCIPNDSIIITLSHVNYKNLTTSVYIDVATKAIDKTFFLLESDNDLPSVTVKAPRIWQRGDTTFFRASAFKEGEEKKLKDLIEKIPGFEIDEEGNILYKKRPIDKITVDGEDMFSDKQKLLLNNFPVHVLENLQIIQNQTNNRLLKGISSENKTYLNLGLNKAKVKSIFGDAEVGYGTSDRYLVSPVLFGLYGKIKTGVIANYNNVGNGIGWQQENELKNNLIRETESWLMQPKNLQILNNFDERRYLLNGQWDTRLQINIPISKQVKSRSSINILRDNISQTSSYRSNLLNDSVYFSRLDVNKVVYRPKIIQISQNIDYQGKKQSLSLQTSYYSNHNSSDQNSTYITADENINASNSIFNNWDSWTIQANYTNRFSEKKAIEWKTIYNTENVIQDARGISSSWYQIFNLPDSSFELFKLGTKRRFETVRSSLGYLSKTNKSLFATELEVEATQMRAYNNANGVSPKNRVSMDIPSLTNGGFYKNLLIGLRNKGRVKIRRQTFDYKTLVGFSKANIQESEKINISNLVYDVNVETSFPFKKIDNKFSATLSQNQYSLQSLYRLPFPLTLSAFHSYSNITLPSKQFEANYAFIFAWPKSLTTSTVVLLYQRKITSVIPRSSYDQFIYIQNDSFANTPLNTFYASVNTSGPSLFLKAMVHVSFGVSVSEINFMRSSDLIKGRYNFLFGTLSLKKNWKKKYFIVLESRISVSKQGQTTSKENSLDPKIFNISNALKQRWLINKNQTFFFNAQFLQNNITSKNSNSILFVDAEWEYKPAKRPYSISVKLDNLTNQDAYHSYYNNPLAQSYYTVPLIKRNMMVSFRYEF